MSYMVFWLEIGEDDFALPVPRVRVTQQKDVHGVNGEMGDCYLFIILLLHRIICKK